MGVTIDGVKEVEAQLKEAVTLLAARLPDAILESAEKVRESAKEKAPVITGALRDSIISEVETNGSEITVEVGPTVDYADDVEFGGLRRRAKPYLRPAIDETEELVIEALVNEMNAILERI